MKHLLFLLCLMSFEVASNLGVAQACEVPPYLSYQEKKELHLAAIRKVESNDGQNTNHVVVTFGLNKNDRAYGQYGLMPITIKDIVRMYPKTFKKHTVLLTMDSKDVHKYMKKHKNLEHQLASVYYDFIVKRVGQKLSVVSYAWFMGPNRAMKDLSSGIDIESHWHVSKTLKARELLVANNL